MAIERLSRVGLFGMTERYNARLALLAPLVASGLALSGCMGSPTYGTDPLIDPLSVESSRRGVNHRASLDLTVLCDGRQDLVS